MIVNKVNFFPIFNQPKINSGIFNTKYIDDVVSVNGRYRLDRDSNTCENPVTPDAYILPGCQKKFKATATANA